MSGIHLVQSIAKEHLRVQISTEIAENLWHTCSAKLREEGNASSAKGCASFRPGNFEAFDKMILRDVMEVLAQTLINQPWTEASCVPGAPPFQGMRRALVVLGGVLLPVLGRAPEPRRPLGL